MKRFETGDTVRVDIPDERDPDHDRLHGRRGTVVQIISDDAGDVTGDSREGFLFRVALMCRNQYLGFSRTNGLY